jgi:hypothetical protein
MKGATTKGNSGQLNRQEGLHMGGLDADQHLALGAGTAPDGIPADAGI